MNVLYLVLVVAMCAWTLRTFRQGYRRLANSRHKLQAYKIYEVRDKLYWLVANGEISTGSRDYQLLERRLNLIVHFTSELNVDRLVEALYDRIVEKRKADELVKIALKQPPAVQEVIVDFIRVVRDIVCENSRFVVWMCRHKFLRSIGHRIVGWKIAKAFGQHAYQRLQTVQKRARVTDGLNLVEQSIHARRNLRLATSPA